MRHKKRTDKLGRKAPHREATLSNIVGSLIEHERVTTTLRIARSATRYADRMITLAKNDSLHARRRAIAFLRPRTTAGKETVRKLFAELGPRYRERPGGYTRILKLESRRGDNAPMAILEFVGTKVTFKERRKPKQEEEELTVETEVDGDVQMQTEEPTEAPQPEDEAARAAAPEAGDEAEKAEPKRPKEKEEAKPEPKDRKGGMGRFFRKLFKGNE